MQFAACVGALFFFFHSSGILGKSNTGKNGCKEKIFPTSCRKVSLQQLVLQRKMGEEEKDMREYANTAGIGICA